MKAIKLLVAVLLAGIVLASCSTDDFATPEQPIVNGGDIEFNIGFAPQVQTRVATDADFKSTWEDGDQVGIYAVSHAIGGSASLATAGNAIHNVKLTYNKTEDTWAAATPLYYKGAQMDFYAYYPYDAQATNPTNITFNVSADQSIAVNYNKSDLLSASTKNIAKSNTPITLTFSHKLALVQVEIDPGAMKGSGPTEELALTLRSCLGGGAFNLGDGSLTTAGDAVAVKMLRVEKSGDADFATKYTYRALVPAQAVESGKSLCLMAQGGQLYNTPKLGAALTLSAGAAKRYSATLPATAIHTVKIPKGIFLMGSSDGSNIGGGNGSGLNTTPAEPDRDDYETQHKVTLTKDYYMSKYTITNAQYAAFLNANAIGSDGKWLAGHYPNEILILASSGSYAWGLKYENNKWVPHTGFENHPVIYVSWYGSVAYCEWISSVTGGSWRLPTEAEWEYACRAETITAYSFGADDTNIGNYAWYGGNSDTKSHPVGEKSPNSWGLYDMHGNVWEWCSDWSNNDSYDSKAVSDPIGPDSGFFRVLRGGGWISIAQSCRSAYRHCDSPNKAPRSVGFRVVFVP